MTAPIGQVDSIQVQIPGHSLTLSHFVCYMCEYNNLLSIHAVTLMSPVNLTFQGFLIVAVQRTNITRRLGTFLIVDSANSQLACNVSICLHTLHGLSMNVLP